LAKRGGKLPPGLQKQLDKNGRLPPGLQKRLEPVPADLNRRLPRLPEFWERVILEECDDSRTCVDDQLPRIAKLEYRACDPPDHDDQSRGHECSRMAGGSRRPLREAGKRR
jgi:hypothetical protein